MKRTRNSDGDATRSKRGRKADDAVAATSTEDGEVDLATGDTAAGGAASTAGSVAAVVAASEAVDARTDVKHRGAGAAASPVLQVGAAQATTIAEAEQAGYAKMSQLMVQTKVLDGEIAAHTAKAKADEAAYDEKRKANEKKMTELSEAKGAAEQHVTMITEAIAMKDVFKIKEAVATNEKKLKEMRAAAATVAAAAVSRQLFSGKTPSSPMGAGAAAAMHAAAGAARMKATAGGAAAAAGGGTAGGGKQPLRSPIKIKHKGGENKSFVQWMVGKHGAREWEDVTHLGVACKGCNANPTDHYCNHAKAIEYGADGKAVLWDWACPVTKELFPEAPIP